MFFGSTLFGSIEVDITIKLLLAALAGGLVGLEREKHGRPAGLRTNLLVAVGSCVMMIVSEAFYIKYGVFDAESTLRLDPSRVAAQIVTGIGFLGAGVILKEGATVRGLTTAASLWAVAGVGMAFGMGFFSLGAIATVLMLISLTFLKKLDPLVKKDRFLTLTVTADNREGLLGELEGIFAGRDLEVSDISSHVDLVNDELFYQMVLTQQEERVGHELTEAIKRLEGIRKVRYF
jgi:putative Mg2+ transporter-C (MgtC) family protein